MPRSRPSLTVPQTSVRLPTCVPHHVVVQRLFASLSPARQKGRAFVLFLESVNSPCPGVDPHKCLLVEWLIAILKPFFNNDLLPHSILESGSKVPFFWKAEGFIYLSTITQLVIDKTGTTPTFLYVQLKCLSYWPQGPQ